jgi:hypothetical protein
MRRCDEEPEDLIGVARLGVVPEPVSGDRAAEEFALAAMDHQVAGDAGKRGRIGGQVGVAAGEISRVAEAAVGAGGPGN